MNIDDIKVGGRYRIRSKRSPHWNPNGHMDHWMGEIVTIREINGTSIKIEEDSEERNHHGWTWDPIDFLPITNEDISDYFASESKDITKLKDIKKSDDDFWSWI